MKYQNLKKSIAMLICVPLLLSGCSTSAQVQAPEGTDKKSTYKIGIAQLVEHTSLDESREGFVDGLKELGVEAEVLVENAQGDVSNAQLISKKLVGDKMDLVFAIATITAQAAKKATEGTEIPVIFTAVTDPVYSQIVSDLNKIDANVTGVTDNVTKENQKSLFESVRSLRNENNAIGIIYNTGESNSEVQVQVAKEVAEEIGMKVEVVGITTVNDIPQAINSISKKVDGLYVTSDNLVATAIPLVAKLAGENNLITVTAVGSYVDEGVLLSNGISYYELGKQAAAMAKKILVDKTDIKEIPVESSSTLTKRVNRQTLEILKLDDKNSVFQGAEYVAE